MAAMTIVAGCLSTTGPPETLFWEGELLVDAAGPADLIGGAAMVALQFQTQVGVGVEEAPANAEWGWMLHEGTCADPQEAAGPITAFSAIEVGGDGVGEVETVLHRRLTGTEYAVQVFENSDGTGGVIACADLTRT